MERQYYIWTADGAKVSVAITPDVINRLRQAAETAVAEIGGILLGRREDEDGIVVEDFDLLPSEHRRGVTFTLSLADRKKLGQLLSESHDGLQSVGSFRTHLRQGLYMDQYDFDLMSAHFPGPADIMLLVRPNDWQAGFFVWDDGDIQRQKSYQEFPFDSAALPLTSLTHTPPAIHVAAPLKPEAAFLASRISIPTLAKVGLIAATLGLAGVLAFYAAHEHRQTSVFAKSEPPASQALPLPKGTVNPPVEPDISQPRRDLSEMHIKIPAPEDRPSAFSSRSSASKTNAVTSASAAPQKSTSPGHTEDTFQPSAPPTIQSAANLLPAIAAPSVILKPLPSPVVSAVSIEPAEPGLISRSINRVPVLNLLQRHKFKAGDKFSPARPVRQVRPRLPSDLERESGNPLPVDVKVWIDKSGQVTKAELLSNTPEPEIGDIAANAALKWTFEPARLADHPVSSEMVMHFRFPPKQSY